MMELPNKAKMFIVAVMLIATAVTVFAIGTYVPADRKEFLVVLAMAVIAARLKLTLPGFESNMSMNLPFLLLAISELTMPEALIVGAASTFVQTLPRSGQTVKPAQAVFNV
jgi:predicted membrane channel-forming protein YqfA (hemolysin III family)